MTTPIRRRSHYLALACGVVALGLASRRWPLFPSWLDKYPGDALWALLVFVLLGTASPRASSERTALAALTLAFAVEFSQLCTWPWLVACRGTTLGHLVLGSHFHTPDLIAYAVGVGLGWLAERCWRARRRDCGAA